MVYELPPMRPPSEAFSVLLRVERGCPWNRCAFCDAYKGMKFSRASIRSVEEVKGDIAFLRELTEQVKAATWLLGSPGRVDDRVRAYLLRRFGWDIAALPWLFRYGTEPRTAFLGDSNPIVLKTEALVEMITALFQAFPSLERLTSYGRAKTVVRKSADELAALRRAGLNRLHIGLETGDGELLERIKKGATPEEMVEAGRRVKEAGITLSEYVMPGLGGEELSRQHALNTARVLNAIDPDFIRFRPFVPRRGTPLFEEYQAGTFRLLSPHGYLREMHLLVSELQVTGRVCFDHIVNPCYRQDGQLVHLLRLDGDGYKFPEEKQEVLARLEEGLGIEESRFIRAEQWMWKEHL